MVEHPQPNAALLANVWRGDVIESQHFGHVAAVSGDGKLVAKLGNLAAVSFLRSSAKPFQAIPLITSGAADHFGFGENELTIACASHNGEPIHVQTVRGMLQKIGLSKETLQCGVHEPLGKTIAQQQLQAGQKPDVLQNNCSGKHAGMLAVSLHLGAPIETYLAPEHPVQQRVREVVAEFCGRDVESIPFAVDGCGLPIFALSVKEMALMFARLVAPTGAIRPVNRDACRRIVSAMSSHPELVSGEGELDTELMRVGSGRFVSKLGAEGVWCAAVLPNTQWPDGLGIAVKIADGNSRARPAIAIEILRQLGILNKACLDRLDLFRTIPVKNHAGRIVGRIQPAFELSRVRI